MNDVLWVLSQGDSPLVIDVPHAGLYVPPEIRADFTPIAQTLPDTDWHVPLLYEFAAMRGASLMAATHSRYVVDLNRDPANAALYPGADNTELCPTRTFHYDGIYRADYRLSAEAVDGRRERYWARYHERLAALIDRARQRHGYAILLDAHSIHSRLPRFFEGQLPDLNLGTADGASCDPRLQRAAWGVIGQAEGFSSVANGRFKGGYITRHYGRPGEGVHALQLEITQRSYMEEGAPYAWDRDRARPLIEVLARLVDALLGMRPS